MACANTLDPGTTRVRFVRNSPSELLRANVRDHVASWKPVAHSVGVELTLYCFT